MKPGFVNPSPTNFTQTADSFSAPSPAAHAEVGGRYAPLPEARAAAPQSLGRDSEAPLRGKICDVVEGPDKGKTMHVEDTIEKVMGIADRWMDPRVNTIPIFCDYFGSSPLPPKLGRHYYGQVESSPKVAHEDWLRPRS